MGLNHLDLAIIAVYLIGITLFGLRFRKKQRSLRDYFLADRNIPWWAIALSIVGAETSTLTVNNWLVWSAFRHAQSAFPRTGSGRGQSKTPRALSAPGESRR